MSSLREWTAREWPRRAFCSLPGEGRQTVRAVAQSGDGMWHLACTEVLGGLTGQGQKQETRAD